MSEAPFGVLGLFPSADDLLKAIPRVKEKGFTKLDAYTPYPVHGLGKALAVPRSKLGVLVFLMGSIGAVSALVFEWWTNAVDYPLLTAGKAYVGWPAWVPVVLEASILVGTFTAALGMLILFNKLPSFGNPVLGTEAIDQITRDRFALMVLTTRGELDTEAAEAALRAAGGDAIEVVPRPHYGTPGAGWWIKTAAVIAIACLAAGLVTHWAVRIVPRVRPMVEMENQPRLDAEEPDTFFANGRGMRRPPTGTVSRGFMPILTRNPMQAARNYIDPLPVTAAVLQRGRLMFNRHCAVCHDKLGTGNAWLDSTYTARPTDLTSASMRRMPDGFLYWVISKGLATMPANEADLSQNDRWAIVRYVRTLQRSQDAPERDVQ